MTDKAEAVRAAASDLISDCLQRHALREAMGGGFRVRGDAASLEIKASMDPALIDRCRCVVRAGVVTIELLDPIKEAWTELYRSDAPELITVTATNSAPVEDGPQPMHGQLCCSKERGFHFWDSRT
jgi:hypothetical protein